MSTAVRPLHRARGRAFGGGYLLASSDPRDLECAAAVLRRFESVLSRFDEGSALSRLNRDGVLDDPPPLLVDALRAGLEAARATGGLVDVSVLPSLEAAGYVASFATLDPRTGGPVLAHRPALAGIRVAAGRIGLPPDARIDLGGVAKGLAVDRALAAMRGERALVNAAGDLRVRGGGFSVDVRVLPDAPHPADAQLRLDDGAVATSGVTRRFWQSADGEPRHHLIDPRSGAPASSPWLAATVWAPTCLDADVRAKEAFLLGGDAPARLAGLGLAGRLVDRDGRVIHAGAWA